MCGIVGVALLPGGWDGDLRVPLHAMTRSLAHRGPDHEGFWEDPAGQIALGHRRLSIIDRSAAGHQPMVSKGGRFVVVFNGEVYNFRRLRERLERAGRAFRGGSDTEVIAEGCAVWGFEETVGRLNGMFAIAVWDSLDRVLHLARDRMGEKPLYYTSAGPCFLFASELRALREHPAFRPVLDPAAAAALLTYNYVPSPGSIYGGVAKLPPGHMLTVRLDDPSIPGEPTAYWSLERAALTGLADPLPTEPSAALDAVAGLLDDAVSLRLEADVPLGALLSGGIDSSLVVAIMTRHARGRVRTFSVGFDEPGYDESAHARRVAEHLGTDHTELRVTSSDALEVVPRLAEIYDEPFADSSQIPTYLIARRAREHVTVALSGDAGDELFAGYSRYAWGKALWSRLALAPRSLRSAIGAGLGACSPAGIDALAALCYPLLPPAWRLPTPGERVHKLAAILSAGSPREMYGRLVTNLAGHVSPGAPVVAPPAAAPGLADAGIVPWMVAADMLGYLPDDILVKVDRATMANGLESRAPFLDHRLVELSWRVPESLKIRGRTGKWLTRQLLYRHVPPALVDRPKVGFAVPIAAWLRDPLRAWADALLAPDRLATSGLVDVAYVRRRWAEHLAGRCSWAPFLWSVLMFESWREAHGM